MTMVEKQAKFLVDVAQLILWAHEQGIVLTGVELLRTPEQQKIYFDSKKSKTMNSRHLEKLAIDLYIIKDGKIGTKEDYAGMAKFWKSLDPQNVAGYDWGWDSNHFERKP